jgi:hypothetical protein
MMAGVMMVRDAGVSLGRGKPISRDARRIVFSGSRAAICRGLRDSDGEFDERET